MEDGNYEKYLEKLKTESITVTNPITITVRWIIPLIEQTLPHGKFARNDNSTIPYQK